MHNIDPNEMDALFREGADNQEFAYNPAAWSLMEEKLDKKKRRKKIMSWIVGLAILVISIPGYRSINTTNGNTASDVTTNNTIDNNTIGSHVAISDNVSAVSSDDYREIEKPESKKLSAKTINLINNVDASTTTKVTSSNGKTADKKNNDNPSYTEENDVSSTSQLGSQSKFTSEDTYLLQDRRLSQDEDLAEEKSISNDEVADNSIASVTQQNHTGLSNALLEERRKQLSILPIPLPKPVLASNQILNLPRPRILSRATQTITVANRYAMTGYGNLDYSSVGLFASQARGYKFGAKVGYQFAANWQIDIGAAFSHKRYGSVGNEYNIEGGWDEMVGTDPTWMDAKCNVIEIPLELSYYVNGYAKDGFFVNVGLSSYILNKEWYGFEYDPQEVQLLVNPELIEEIKATDIQNTNYHLSGVGKISFGYQKILSNNTAVEISPYLQIPLTGIGEGKVNLYSTGVQFALKFNSK